MNQIHTCDLYPNHWKVSIITSHLNQNDTVLKIMFFSKKTMVDKYAWVYFGKLPWKTGKTVDQSIMQTIM